MKTGVLEMDIVMSLMTIPAGHLDGRMDGQRRLASRPNEQRRKKISCNKLVMNASCVPQAKLGHCHCLEQKGDVNSIE